MAKIRKKSLARTLGAVTSSVAAAATVVVATGQAAQAASASPVSAPPGATVRVTDASLSAATASPAVLLSTAACANYAAPSATAGTVSGETVTKVDSSTVSFRVPTLALGTNGVARNYNICVYPSATANAAPIGGTTSVLTTYQSLTSNPSTGVSGATNNLALTASNPIFTGLTSLAGLFTAGGCPATYTVSSGTLPATVVKTGLANTTATVTVPSGVVGAQSFNTCIYPGTGANDALLSASTYQTTLPQLTLSSASGPFDAVNNITASSGTTSLFSGIAAPGVLFTPGTCPSTYDTTASTTVAVPTSGVRKLANNRIAITVPKLPITNRQPQTYQLCTYTGSSTESTVLGAAQYISTVLPNPTSVTPNAGPTTGGITVTVNGTDFPTSPGSITASLGGVDLLNVTPVNSTSFTATLPSRTAGDNAALVVTTLSGTRTLPGAFSFRNALKLIGTTTAPNTSAATDVLVQGTDFLSQAFGTSSDSAKILLTKGNYDPTVDENGNRANPPVAECTNPLVLSDTELVCTLRLNRRLDKTGNALVNPLAAARTLTSDITTILGSRLVTSLLGKFTLDDVGRVITPSSGTDIPANTTIKSVITPFLALLSAPVNGTNTSGSPLTVDLGGTVRSITAANGLITTANSNVVSLAGATLTSADVGRVITGVTGIADGTSITAVLPGGTSATLSAPATAGTNATLAVTSGLVGTTSLTGTFNPSTDVGAVFGANNLGIPTGTKIISPVTSTTATLSQALTSTISSAVSPVIDRPLAVSLTPGAPVQEGAYNLSIVSNAAPNAASTVSDYKQTALTSGSIFTVSPF